MTSPRGLRVEQPELLLEHQAGPPVALHQAEVLPLLALPEAVLVLASPLGRQEPPVPQELRALAQGPLAVGSSPQVGPELQEPQASRELPELEASQELRALAQAPVPLAVGSSPQVEPEPQASREQPELRASQEQPELRALAQGPHPRMGSPEPPASKEPQGRELA